ncbi:MAG TPA: glycerol-3-phosphate 1-O-acyltransferase PlsY [Pyrinomonadaceae bacterium]|nr:glycerol-3-phosphate 1-O-acyltransferase PlsY [Pyrinomonadaceae bacterium]
MQALITIAVAYLLGSIPFGYLIVRAAAGADVRESGSGGTGATNVSRRAGKLAGVLTLVLDALKGAAAIATARWLLGSSPFGVQPVFYDSWVVAMAAVAVIVGHCFPVWLKFRGGKGVATGVGVFLMLAPLAVPGAGLVFVIIVWLTRYISLGSIVATALLPAIIFATHLLLAPVPSFQPVLTAAVVGGSLIIFMHRANIRRLLSGTETKFK